MLHLKDGIVEYIKTPSLFSSLSLHSGIPCPLESSPLAFHRMTPPSRCTALTTPPADCRTDNWSCRTALVWESWKSTPAPVPKDFITGLPKLKIEKGQEHSDKVYKSTGNTPCSQLPRQMKLHNAIIAQSIELASLAKKNQQKNY